ncbi:hypothetical protein [Streptomyces sp. NPDC021212]|uniref:hypothetical protein n=1 Tax=Streptomyces sp. NPDC021212 TaxID=3365118 RepID=UPI0037A3923F
MRGARELDGRAVPPESPTLRRLVRGMRERIPEGGGGAVVTAAFTEMSTQGALRDLEGKRMEGGGIELFDLVEDLREIEADAESGRYPYLRVIVTPDETIVDRAYDHWPDWAGSGFLGDAAPVGDLRGEMARRAERWRPEWTRRLDDEVPYSPEHAGESAVRSAPRMIARPALTPYRLAGT